MAYHIWNLCLPLKSVYSVCTSDFQLNFYKAKPNQTKHDTTLLFRSILGFRLTKFVHRCQRCLIAAFGTKFLSPINMPPKMLFFVESICLSPLPNCKKWITVYLLSGFDFIWLVLHLKINYFLPARCNVLSCVLTSAAPIHSDLWAIISCLSRSLSCSNHSRRTSIQWLVLAFSHDYFFRFGG